MTSFFVCSLFCFYWVLATDKFSPWWFHSLLFLLQDLWETMVDICRRQKHDQRAHFLCVRWNGTWVTDWVGLNVSVLRGSLQLRNWWWWKNMTFYPTAWYKGQKNTDPDQLVGVYLNISNISGFYLSTLKIRLFWGGYLHILKSVTSMSSPLFIQ